jgi:glucose dehydrogenase
MRSRHHRSLHRLLLAGAVMLAAAPAVAADVTPERLTNPEPGNWLMNHRTYDAQRFSPLDRINKTNIKSLKLAYAVAIGGTSVNENLESTPLVEDGFLYVVDLWGGRLQDRRPFRRRGPDRLAHGSGAGEDAGRQSRRRAVG